VGSGQLSHVSCVWKCQRIGVGLGPILACLRICDDKHDTLPADDLQPCHLFARHSEEQPGKLAAWQPGNQVLQFTQLTVQWLSNPIRVVVKPLTGVSHGYSVLNVIQFSLHVQYDTLFFLLKNI